MRAVGIERTLFSSDCGNPDYPPVEDGLALWADRLLDAGFDEDEVREMIVGAVAAAGRSLVSRKLLVVGAHSADFVWRAGGAIAVTTSAGGAARVLALSYGERGESGELWKEPGQTVERVKEVRHGEAERAAAALGAEFECLDLGDYPLEVDGDALVSIADRIREFAPDVVLTHTDRDPFNPDHASAFFAVERARALAAGAGVPSAFETVQPPELLLFEPHQPELCNFVADDVRRHHAGDRAEERGDGGDEGAGVPRHVLRRSAPSSAATMRGARRATPRSGTRRRSSA